MSLLSQPEFFEIIPKLPISKQCSFPLLEQKIPILVQEELKSLVNFKLNSQLPIHNWFFYREGYCGKLVDQLLAGTSGRKEDVIVVDPFCGCGTTLVSAQVNGFACLGVDANPVSVFVSQVKTDGYTVRDIRTFRETVASLDSERGRCSNNIPRLGILADAFDEPVLETLLRIKYLYEDCGNRRARNLLKLAYLSIIEDVSNRKKDGNGIKRVKRHTPPNVGLLFRARSERILHDLETKVWTRHPKAYVVLGDSKQLGQIASTVLGNAKFSEARVIFSPPYANCFDYCEVYKLEMWMGDFVRDYKDFRPFRDDAIRSHVNASFDRRVSWVMPEVETIASRISETDIWNRNIPDMLRGYFDDMRKVLRQIAELPADRVICSIVVANSAYRGVIVPTDLLLTRIGKEVGFRVVGISVCRSLRSSPQQMRQLSDSRGYLRESLITLQR